MTASTLFSICNLVAMLGWVALAISLFAAAWRGRIWVATGLVIPAVFGLLYIVTFAVAVAQGPSGAGYNSIVQVRTLFAGDFGVVTGWVHYLAFDLVVGTWIVRTGLAAGLSKWALLPCALLTYLVGPVGFVLYLGLRFAGGKGAPYTDTTATAGAAI